MKVHRTRIGHCRDPSSVYLAEEGRCPPEDSLRV